MSKFDEDKKVSKFDEEKFSLQRQLLILENSRLVGEGLRLYSPSGLTVFSARLPA